MEHLKNKAIDFLKKHNMDPTQIDMDDCCKVFLDEMDRGLTGRESSLKMIPTYIEIEKNVPKDKPVVVMDAGGTNFRVATVWFNKDNKPEIEDFETYRMPGVDNKVTKDEFFEVMAGHVKDIVDKSENIGFCFSYPTEISPNKDGKLIRFSKEIKAEEVEGQMIGENLNAALSALGYKDKKHVVILNDTVTTLLAGRAASFKQNFDSFVGFILGTGTNCAYIESNRNIKKKPELDPARSQIINIESGAFAKAPMGNIDRKFDKSTINPGEHTFEKMISGAYLGPLILLTIQEAAKEKLLSEVFAEKLKNLKELSTKDANDFLNKPKDSDNPLSSIATEHSDRVILIGLIERMVERAAVLTAINLSSAVLKSDRGKDPSRPVCIVAEGTTFYKLRDFQSIVESYLQKYLVEHKERFYEIIGVEDATLIGAAIAGLTN